VIADAPSSTAGVQSSGVGRRSSKTVSTNSQNRPPDGVGRWKQERGEPEHRP
jgi:hypothetical protein